MKLVINIHSGFGLSRKAWLRFKELGHPDALAEEDQLIKYAEYAESDETWESYLYDIRRNDPILLQVIEEFGLKASGGAGAELKILEIPDDVDWDIWSGDSGCEVVIDKNRFWYWGKK